MLFRSNDTAAYQWTYEESQRYSWEKAFSFFTDYSTIGMARDPGYLIFQKIIHSIFGDSYQLFLFTIAIIFFTAFGRFLYLNTFQLRHIIFAYVIYSVLFYSFFSITGIRQTIAISLLLFGYEYLKNKRYLIFSLLYLIVFTFHRSSLVFLLFIPLSLVKNPYRLLLFALGIFPFLMLIKQEYINFLQIIIGYENYGKYEGAAGTFVFTSLLILVCILFLIYRDTMQRLTPYTNQLYSVFTLAVLFVPLTWIEPTAMRVVLYFSLFLVLLIPLLVESIGIKYKLRNTFFLLVIIVLIMLYLRSAWATEYKFFWQDMPLPDHY